MGKDLKSKIFRRAERMTIFDGTEEIPARGVITKLTDSDVEPYKQLAYGRISVPLCVFMGDVLPNCGDIIDSDKGKYSVIMAEEITAFGKSFCARAILEKIGGVEH